jgi:hypothetical protein
MKSEEDPEIEKKAVALEYVCAKKVGEYFFRANKFSFNLNDIL